MLTRKKTKVVAGLGEGKNEEGGFEQAGGSRCRRKGIKITAGLPAGVAGGKAKKGKDGRISEFRSLEGGTVWQPALRQACNAFGGF